MGRAQGAQATLHAGVRRRSAEAGPVTGDALLAALPAARIHPDDAAAWADLGSGAHRDIQDAVRYQPFGWAEQSVWLPPEEPEGEEVELHMGSLVAALDDAIAEHALPADAVAYRGVSDLQWMLAQAGCDDPAQLPGRAVVDAGFLPVSADSGVASMWGGDAVLELRLPAGTRALSLPALGYVEQAELLLARNSKLRFDSCERATDGRWRIAATVEL